jgi:hypothetical protein
MIPQGREVLQGGLSSIAAKAVKPDGKYPNLLEVTQGLA